MNQAVIKTHYSASELAVMKLDGLPNSRQNMLLFVERHVWAYIEVTGKGGTRREYAPPPAIMAQIRDRAVQGAVAKAQSLPVPAALKAVDASVPVKAANEAQLQLTTAEQLQADCRKGVLLAIKRVMVGCGVGKEAAISAVRIEAMKEPTGTLARMFAGAEDSRGRKDGGAVASSRTIKRWFDLEKSGSTAAKKREKDMSIPSWAPQFIACWRPKQGQTVAAAYKIFEAEWAEGEIPSEHAVRRFLKKLPPEVLYRLQHSGAALKAKLPYVDRDWTVFETGECWVGDGHGMKMKVAHPDHGQPFQPEVTLMLDARSRKCVGWSVSFSENVLAVADALRHAACSHPLPLIYYSDNGAGETAKMLDAPVVGLFGRLGIDHQTGIPGNPQGRGLIERLWQTLTIPLARESDTFHGHGADKETLRLAIRAVSKALNAQKANTDVKVPLPSWKQFIDALELAVADYNANHRHSALPKRNGRHMTPNEFWLAHPPKQNQMLDEATLRELFRPHVIRTARRGMVSLWNNSYFSQALMLVDGQEVQVGYDIHDAERVVIRTLEGVFVCEAEFEGNKVDAFPKPYVEKLRDTRIDGMVQRGQNKIDLAEAERRTTITLAPAEVLPGITGAQIAGAFERMPIAREAMVVSEAKVLPIEDAGFRVPSSPEERIALHIQLQQQGGLSERETKWLASYAKSHEFKVMSLKHAAAVEAAA
ncbi:Mu transposase C-terminal domain-containing protein [Chitinibacter sp. S2-10]|uniref:Mu transposase C-terminal domain-containing protein n=1 Tax=Chitinibacter sp. S2-10 TaxID=3373597 RepID=UPI003977935A